MSATTPNQQLGERVAALAPGESAFLVGAVSIRHQPGGGYMVRGGWGNPDLVSDPATAAKRARSRADFCVCRVCGVTSGSVAGNLCIACREAGSLTGGIPAALAHLRIAEETHAPAAFRAVRACLRGLADERLLSGD